jgi:hypothetical protein
LWLNGQRARKTPCGFAPRVSETVGYDVAEDMGAAQIRSVVERHTAGQVSITLILTAEGSIALQTQNVKG